MPSWPATKQYKISVPALLCMSQGVFQKDLFAVFKVKVTVKAHIVKIQFSSVSSELLTLLHLGLMAHHHHQLDCLERLDCCGQGQRKGSKFNECSSV